MSTMLQSAWPSPPLTRGDACTSSISGCATCSVDCGLPSWELLPADKGALAPRAALFCPQHTRRRRGRGRADKGARTGLPSPRSAITLCAVDDLSLCTLPARGCDATGRALLRVVGLGARTNARRGQGRASASSLEARARSPPRSGLRTGELLLEESVGGYAESRRSVIEDANARWPLGGGVGGYAESRGCRRRRRDAGRAV